MCVVDLVLIHTPFQSQGLYLIVLDRQILRFWGGGGPSEGGLDGWGIAVVENRDVAEYVCIYNKDCYLGLTGLD